MTVDETVDVRPLDASPRWADALRGDGPTRAEALRWLRAHVGAAATFELDRRGITVDGAQAKAASLVRAATEAALAAVLADVDRFRAQSAFTTCTAKYAIRETAAAPRKNGIAPWKQDAAGARHPNGRTHGARQGSLATEEA